MVASALIYNIVDDPARPEAQRRGGKAREVVVQIISVNYDALDSALGLDGVVPGTTHAITENGGIRTRKSVERRIVSTRDSVHIFIPVAGINVVETDDVVPGRARKPNCVWAFWMIFVARFRPGVGVVPRRMYGITADRDALAVHVIAAALILIADGAIVRLTKVRSGFLPTPPGNRVFFNNYVGAATREINANPGSIL